METLRRIVGGKNRGSKSSQSNFEIWAVLAGIAAIVLNAGASTLALPTIGRSLLVEPAQAMSIVTAYQSALVMGIFPSAAIADRFGRRRIFCWGIVVFAVGSIACATSPSLFALAIARFVQGLGGSAVLALGIPLLRTLSSDDASYHAIGWNAISVALSAAIAPLLAAFVLAHFSWHLLYALNAPICAVILMLLREQSAEVSDQSYLDVISIGLLFVTVGMLTLSAELAFEQSTTSIVLLLAGLLCLVKLTHRELKSSNPTIPFDLLGITGFRIAALASVLCYSGQSLGLIALSFYLQDQLAKTPLESAIYILPWPVFAGFTAAIGVWFLKHMSVAALCAVGGSTLAIGLAVTAFCSPSFLASAPGYLVFLFASCGIGFGLFQIPNNYSLLTLSPRTRIAAAAAMMSASRLLGQVLGAVLMSLIFVLDRTDSAPRSALLMAANLALIGGAISFLSQALSADGSEAN